MRDSTTMTNEPTSGPFPWKLSAIFVLFVAGISITGQVYYSNQKEQIRLEKQNSLATIADLKVAQIIQWHNERIVDAKAISESQLAVGYVAALSRSPNLGKHAEELVHALKTLRNSEYERANLLDVQGKDLLPAASPLHADSSELFLFRRALSTNEILFSGLRWDSTDGHIYVDMVAPVQGREKEKNGTAALVLLRMDASQYFYPIVESWPTHSKTSEVLLVERDGNQVVYLSELRHKKDSALKFRLPASNKELPASMAVADSEGIVEGIDYRGVPVLAALKKIPGFPWRLIAKVDQDEVYAPIRERSQTVFAFVAVLILAAAASTGLLWRHQRSLFYRRHLELELKRRVIEEHFDTMMKYANDAILIIDMDGRIIDANEKATMSYGYAREELIGRSVQDTLATEVRAGLSRKMIQVQQRNGMIFESVHQRKDGSTFHVEVSSRVIIADGEQFYENIVRDITDRKLAEQGLREMERRFRSLIENASDLILVTNQDGCVVYASPSVERVLGRAVDELREKTLEEFVHADDRAATVAVRLKAMQNPGQVYKLEHRLKHAEGWWLTIESYVKYLSPLSGAGEIIINARDISERTRANEALRLSEEKFSKAFLTSPDAICINRLTDGLFIEINDGFENITGYKKEEVVGRSSEEINLWSIQEERHRFIRELVRQGELNDFESDFVMKDGTKRVGLLSAKVLKVHGEAWILSITRDITERKRSERILRESEEQYRLLFENNPHPMWVYDTHTLAFLAVNDAATKHYGYSKNEFLSMTIKDIRPSEDINRLVENVRNLHDGVDEAGIWRHRKKDGSIIFVEITSHTMMFRGRHAEIVLANDITERKKAEEQLHIQKAHLEQLFEAAPEAIVLLQPNERIIQVNPEFTKLFGYTQEEAFDHPINDLIVPGRYREEGLELTRKVAQGSVINAEAKRHRKDGTLVEVSILGTPVHVDGGQIAVYAIYRDITDRKKAEEALRQSESSFRGLFESVNDAIYIQDREGRFVDVNQGAVKMYGHPHDYFIGKSPLDLAAPQRNDMATIQTLVRRAFEGESQRFEFWGLRSNGEIFPKEVRVNKGTHFGKDVVIALAQDITERKRFEEALRETNRTLESLINASPLAIAVVDQEGRVQLWNPAADRMFGWKAEEVIGKPNPIVPKEKEFLELQKRVLNGETPGGVELQRQKKDGSEIYISLSTASLLDADGHVKGVMAILADITERKRAEEQWRESEEQLRLALTAANMMSWELDLVTGKVTWSESGGRFYGLGPNEFVGTREAYVNLIHPDDRAVAEQLMDECIRQRKEYKTEFRIVWPDGSIHWHAAYGRASHDEGGLPIKVSGIGVDITERKQAEESIQKLLHAVEQTDEVIFMTEPDGSITYVNPAFERLYRYTKEEVVGRTPRILKSGAMSQEYYSLFWRDLLTGKSIRAEHINKSKDGKIIIVETSINPVYDLKGKLSGFISVQEDISERKRNEAERKRLEAQLLQTQKLESIGTLAGGIAHDFNNILGIILAYSSSLRTPGLPHQKVKGAADVINQAVERGAELVKQILTFARKTDIVYGLVNINVMAKELRKMLTETFPRTITITTELGNDVPDITADAAQVHQAILNICVNARDAMPAGGKLTFRTSIGTRAEVSSYFPEATSERYIRVSIADTGTGMNEVTRHRIFEPFFTTKPKGKGTGLGLSVVYGVIKNHNGFVRVDSEIGRGTTFHLYFPAPVRTVQIGDQIQRSLIEIPGGKEIILLVEDEEPLLGVLAGLLKSKGYRVLTARDGYEAVETYEQYCDEIAVVVSDLGLPKMTGQDAFMRMKSVNPRVKVIFGTGYLDPELKTELLNLGARGFLSKPYSQDDLLRRIRELIDFRE